MNETNENLCPVCSKPNGTEEGWPCPECIESDPAWKLATQLFDDGCNLPCGAGYDPNDFCCLRHPEEAYRIAKRALTFAKENSI